MGFSVEKDFEDALINLLTKIGWKGGVIEYADEKALIDNWADFLFLRNNTKDRLNGVPLSANEMQCILDTLKTLKTPFQINQWLNGQTVTVKRDGDSPDIEHRGKEISLEIYNKLEIATGSCRYQIARQPRLAVKNKLGEEKRRGDFMLLINGMPLIHVELKRTGVGVNAACGQIGKYLYEGVFTGLFSLVQLFVAMNPEETVYFVNPGSGGKLESQYFFHWTDKNNVQINNWEDVARNLLNIPMAHQMIGWYLVADKTDGILKVMRPYQYYAAVAIADCVHKHDWSIEDKLGGYIWHTTGSGKTMTSFKCAQLVASTKDADKVVFLLDRIELSTQSLLNYRGFAGFNDDVSDTGSTSELIGLLKDDHVDKTLVVTSIQKMSRIKDGDNGNADIDKIRSKRLVFIIDECHRSTFGEMLRSIKATFPKAMFFGFTGTPVFDENSQKNNTTSDLFGNELHRYALVNGMNDGNVLGFDANKVTTFKDDDIKEKVALSLCGASNVAEAEADNNKKVTFIKFRYETPMYSYFDEKTQKRILGVEAYIKSGFYMLDEHTHAVVTYIKDKWDSLSHRGKFHAIFATSSIPEAINYYRLLKEMAPELKVSALFDPNLDPENPDDEESDITEKIEKVQYKEEGLIEIIDDYNKHYGLTFNLATFPRMKEDIGQRLAHKTPYRFLKKDQQLDILIVVNQMLTGYDSKWVNTLYLDKEMVNQHLIQAFSRTNRLFGIEKPFGVIRYFRRPHTMQKNIERAFALYAGDRPEGLFVQKLPSNVRKMNELFSAMKALFEAEGIKNFETLPQALPVREEFSRLFKVLYSTIEGAKLQEFTWEKTTYLPDADSIDKEAAILMFDKDTYDIICLRYSELNKIADSQPMRPMSTFELEAYISEIDSVKLDKEYMNERFHRVLETVLTGEDKKKQDDALAVLHNNFARLTVDQQRYAEIIIHDLRDGKLKVEDNKTFMDYINDYKDAAKNKRIKKVVQAFGLNEELLREIISSHVNEDNIDQFNRFTKLLEMVDKEKAKLFLESEQKTQLKMYQVNMKLNEYMKNFIINESKGIENN